MKPNLPFLETMITQVCNISCLGCTNYSDLKHKGYVPWATGRLDIEAWSELVNIGDFCIMGGEPMINPEWRQWVMGMREVLPNSRLRFNTNGLLLQDAKEMLDIMTSVGNIVFKITVHVKNQQLEDTIQQVFALTKWDPVVEYGIARWVGPNGVRFQINRPQTFVKSYQGTYQDMQPWNSDPAEAFSICCQQTCPLLYQGRIYKCSTSALLKNTLERFGNPNLSQWETYIPKGIGVDSAMQEINNFCLKFGQPESICGQCPAPGQSNVPHLATVNIKSLKIQHPTAS